MKRLLAALSLAALSLTAPVSAHGYEQNGISIEHPWSRPTAPGVSMGAVYMTLENEGAETDRLIAAETPVAAKVEFHVHVMEEGVARMRPIEAVEVTPGSPTIAAPGGLHLMLIGLKQPLAAEDTFPLTLTFEKAGRIEVEVYVEQKGATEPSHMPGMEGHEHGH